MDDYCFIYYLATNLKLNFNVTLNNNLKCRRSSEFCQSCHIYLFSGPQTFTDVRDGAGMWYFDSIC